MASVIVVVIIFVLLALAILTAAALHELGHLAVMRREREEKEVTHL